MNIRMAANMEDIAKQLSEGVQIGSILCGERVTLGKSLDDVQEELKLRREIIENLERNNLASFDRPEFVPSYIRCYANYLRLNQKQVVKAYQDQCGLEVPTDQFATAQNGRSSKAKSAPKPVSASKPAGTNGNGSGGKKGNGAAKPARSAPEDRASKLGPISGPEIKRDWFEVVGETLRTGAKFAPFAVVAAILGAVAFFVLKLFGSFQQLEIVPAETPSAVVTRSDEAQSDTGSGADVAIDYDELYGDLSGSGSSSVTRAGRIADIDLNESGALSGQAGNEADSEAAGAAAAGEGVEQDAGAAEAEASAEAETEAGAEVEATDETTQIAENAAEEEASASEGEAETAPSAEAEAETQNEDQSVAETQPEAEAEGIAEAPQAGEAVENPELAETAEIAKAVEAAAKAEEQAEAPAAQQQAEQAEAENTTESTAESTVQTTAEIAQATAEAARQAEQAAAAERQAAELAAAAREAEAQAAKEAEEAALKAQEEEAAKAAEEAAAEAARQAEEQAAAAEAARLAEEEAARAAKEAEAAAEAARKAEEEAAALAAKAAQEKAAQEEAARKAEEEEAARAAELAAADAAAKAEAETPEVSDEIRTAEANAAAIAAELAADSGPVLPQSERPASIELLPAGKVWVRVTDSSGTKVYQNLMEPVRAYNVQPGRGNGTFFLRAGNASTLYVRLNGGEIYGPLARPEKGVVAGIELSPEYLRQNYRTLTETEFLNLRAAGAE